MKVLQGFKKILLAIFILFTVNAYSATTEIEDGLITTKIVAKIALDKSLSIFKINVNVSDGFVQLSGEVNSDTDASVAVELAQSTEGVADVDISHLTVKESKHPVSDILITAKIDGLFIREKLFGENIAIKTIHVETNNGVVYLSGTVENQAQADNAETIAKSVKGVKRVESRLTHK